MRPEFKTHLRLITLVSMAGIIATQAENQYWNPSPLSDNWAINYNDTSAGSVNGGAFTNAVTLTVVPEPGVALLGGLGLLALLRRRR